MSWGERWLLETAVHAWIPLRSLVHPRVHHEFNRPGHHLLPHELADALERLLERGDVVARTDALGVHRPSREALLAALVFGPRPRDPLCYGLTPQGGARWEEVARADWSRYVRDSVVPPEADRPSELTGLDRARVEARLTAHGDVRPETVLWERLEAWAVGPWKTLAAAHRVTFLRRLEDPAAPGWPARVPPAEPWFHEEPLAAGALFSTPLEGGGRGLFRVVATLEGLEPEPWRFVIACDPGEDAELPVNLARAGRRFLPLTHASWKGALLGGWLQGPPPPSWRFEGGLDVRPEERAMALETGSSASWGWLHDRAAREALWRRNRAQYECATIRDQEEVERRRAHARDPARPARSPEVAERRRSADLKERLLALQPPEPPEVLADWTADDRLERWCGRLEGAVRRLLSTNRDANGRLDYYEVRIEAPSPDGLVFDLVLGFRPGETYCCPFPGCHLGLSGRGEWSRLRRLLAELGQRGPIPGLTVRKVVAEVQAGTVFAPPLRTSVPRTTRREEQGWVERETLRESPRAP